jgi:3-hydroxyisobutyrate dehydrogenase-like beta-hydroxyacid dehydrogenase
MMSIGLIGLGNAGGPFGQRLLSKGHQIKVFDLNSEAMDSMVKLGATKVGSAQEAVTDVTITVLPSSVEVRAAVFGERGVLEGIRPGNVLIDLSGTDPDCARELEQKVKERGGEFLGGTLHADGAPAVTIPKGLLSIVIGGNKKTLQACEGILKDLAQKVLCLPEPWMPKSLKIGVIMMATANSIIITEILTWLTAQGIDPRLFLELERATGSQESSSRIAQFFKRKKNYGGALSNSYKDLRQALKVASDLNLPLPFTSLANQIQDMGRAQGLTRTPSSDALGTVYEKLTGVDLSQAVLDEGRTFPEPQEPQVIYL